MKKILLGFFLPLFCFAMLEVCKRDVHAVHNLIFKDASEMNTGTLDPARVSPTTFTLRGSKWSVDIDASTTTLQSNIDLINPNAKSTNTITLTYGGFVNLSTIGVRGFPGAQFYTGKSTIHVVAVEAGFVLGSSVGMTSIQLVISSAAGNMLSGAGAIINTSSFPRIDIPTTTVLNTPSFSVLYTTSFVVGAYNWIGVQSTTAPITGTLPSGLNVNVYGWEKFYGATQ